jgi:hypothetical protein
MLFPWGKENLFGQRDVERVTAKYTSPRTSCIASRPLDPTGTACQSDHREKCPLKGCIYRPLRTSPEWPSAAFRRPSVRCREAIDRTARLT